MNEKRLTELQTKWLKGDISPEEIVEFAHWYDANQNRPVYVPRGYCKKQGGTSFENLEANTAKLYGSDSVTIAESLRTNKLKYYYYAMAAACLLAVLGVFIWFKQPNEVNMASKMYDMDPGGAGLTLTLANGDELAIDSLADGLIASENGVEIFKKNGMVYYTGKAANTFYNTASTKKGRKFKLLLPDGSNVWLNAESSIKYPTAFEGEERRIEVSGEAYFEVSADPHKPFVVQAGSQKIVVLGTHFNINSYINEDAIVTTLLEGKVKVIANGESVNIKPNQQLTWIKKSNTVNVSHVDPTIATGWVEDEFNMHDTDLATVMRRIERWYGVEVRYEPGVNKNQTFFGSTPMNQKLSEVLKVLELSGVKSSIKDGVVIIHKH